MLKNSLATVFERNTCFIGDKGYQGIQDLFPNSIIPTKATKNHPLTADEIAGNKALSQIRIGIEHVNREIKIFRICKETYRNKGRRGLLRVQLVASFYNHRLSLTKPSEPVTPPNQVGIILLYKVESQVVSE